MEKSNYGNADTTDMVYCLCEGDGDDGLIDFMLFLILVCRNL